MKLHSLANSSLLIAFALLSGCSLFRAPTTGPQFDTSGAIQPGQAFEHTIEERERFIAESTDGYMPDGEPVVGTLDGYQPMTVELERGFCYAVVLRLDRGASFSELATKGLAFKVRSESAPDISAGPGVHGPGGVGHVGCPQETTEASFDLQALADPSRAHELGSGGYSVQWVRTPVSDEQLDALAADSEQQRIDSETFQRERSAEQVAAACDRCRKEHLACLREGAGASKCEDKRDSCVALHSDLSQYSECTP